MLRTCMLRSTTRGVAEMVTANNSGVSQTRLAKRSMTVKRDIRRTTSQAKACGYMCRWELRGGARAENISPLLVSGRAYSEPVG